MSDAPDRDPTTPGLWTRLRRRLLGIVVLVVAGSLGGVATTALWPVTAQTRYFQAQVRVLPSIWETSVVHMPTVLGDITLEFAGPVPAPGVEARIQVRPEITDQLASAQADVTALAPPPEELRTAMTEGLRELTAKFVGGVLVTDLVLVGMWAWGRRSAPSRVSWAAVALAASTATVVPAAAGAMTYRSSNVASFELTSVLGTVQQNSNLFDDIPSRAQQATPYVQNLLALSDAMAQEFAPEESTGSAARFLLISDLHGMNYYPLIQQIVDDEQITAVIDTGDLVNFGREQEGEISGIYRGIENLGVPYIFVRGNHDGLYRHDEGVVQRMGEIPNVMLLEPSDGLYQEATVNGVRISGFNDWRHFGEEGTDFVALAEEAAQRYAIATESLSAPDIVAAHEPFGLENVETAAVTVNGHMHVAALNGHRIQVGSFTGGGLVNHFQVPADLDPDIAGELVGVPYSFDILSFGEDCRPQTLTRYTYRNLVSGRPQFDSVTVLNADRFAASADSDIARSCGPDQGSSLTPISELTPVAPEED